MSNSYRRDGSFNPDLTTIKYSYDPAQDNKQQMNTNTRGGIRYKKTQVIIREDSSIAADRHQAKLNKVSKKSKAIRKRTN